MTKALRTVRAKVRRPQGRTVLLGTGVAVVTALTIGALRWLNQLDRDGRSPGDVLVTGSPTGTTRPAWVVNEDQPGTGDPNTDGAQGLDLSDVDNETIDPRIGRPDNQA